MAQDTIYSLDVLAVIGKLMVYASFPTKILINQSINRSIDQSILLSHSRFLFSHLQTPTPTPTPTPTHTNFFSLFFFSSFFLFFLFFFIFIFFLLKSIPSIMADPTLPCTISTVLFAIRFVHHVP